MSIELTETSPKLRIELSSLLGLRQDHGPLVQKLFAGLRPLSQSS